MGLRLFTPPVASPVSLAEAKTHLRVDHNDEDVYIQTLIDTATGYLDGEYSAIGKCLITQTWELLYDAFPCEGIKIPLAPLISVDHVRYYNSDGVWTTISSSDYEVDTANRFGWVVPKSDGWPTDVYESINVVNVRFVAGYGDASAVPPAIKAAILLTVGDLYTNRKTISEGSIAETKVVEMLLSAYRPMGV